MKKVTFLFQSIQVCQSLLLQILSDNDFGISNATAIVRGYFNVACALVQVHVEIPPGQWNLKIALLLASFQGHLEPPIA